MNSALLPPQLHRALKAGALRSIDLHLARNLLGHAHPQSESARIWVACAIAALSRAHADGDVCIDLSVAAERPLFVEQGHAAALTNQHDDSTLTAPPLAAWEAALLASGLVGTANQQQTLPLVLDAAHRLYLYRDWSWEQDVATALQARATFIPDIDSNALRTELKRWFADRQADDLQQLGAAIAVLRQLTIISGGPGTGKTTTVARILALLLALGGDKTPIIRLVAPTGKAAARLTQSIRLAKENLRAVTAAATTTADAANTAAIINAMPETASTIHRLLGMHADRRSFVHDANNPLMLDVLLVDEASMIDLALMARLLAALPPQARLILLGDRDQLAAVEAGNVLGDLCQSGEPQAQATPWSDALLTRLRAIGLTPQQHADTDNAIETTPATSPMADSLVVLEKSHRFAAGSGIALLAFALKKGHVADALALCSAHAQPTENRHDLHWLSPTPAALPALIAAATCTHWENYRYAKDPLLAGQCFEQFRFLCAVREGPFGVDSINAQAKAALVKRGFIDPHAQHYAGEPILIIRNDYSMDLFNGDVGLILPDVEADGLLRAFFMRPDGSIRRIALNRLPPHEPAWAMTVHKSQGSEFDRVVVILPEQNSPVLTRELLYTAVTRARRHVSIWAPRLVLEQSMGAHITRASGLRAALWQPAQGIMPSSQSQAIIRP